jgi:hypothetical protein
VAASTGAGTFEAVLVSCSFASLGLGYLAATVVVSDLVELVDGTDDTAGKIAFRIAITRKLY